MAVRFLLVLALLAIPYGCGQSSSPPEQGEKEGGGEPRSVTPSSDPGHQETSQQGTTQRETTLLREVADKKIAFGLSRPARSSDAEFDSGIYVMNADGSNLARLTDGTSPDWSPDGKKIAYTGYLKKPNPEQYSAPDQHPQNLLS